MDLSYLNIFFLDLAHKLLEAISKLELSQLLMKVSETSNVVIVTNKNSETTSDFHVRFANESLLVGLHRA